MAKEMKKKAMVLAAGMGSRLQELTKTKPKALVEYNGKTLLEIVLRRLIHHGFRDVVINIHHFPEQIISFVESKKNFGINVVFSNESEELLDTGGGIKKASWFFEDDPILVHNVDIYTDLNLDELYNYNSMFHYLATFAVKKRATSRPFYMDKNGLLCGWENMVTGEQIITRDTEYEKMAYSGIAVLSKEFLDMLPGVGKYSLTEEVLKLSKKHDIHLFQHKGVWNDMGKPEAYLII